MNNSIHLGNIHEFSLQQVFDKVATHLLTQKQPAMRKDNTTCAYRAPDGKTCAVGCLMTDEEYNPRFEGVGITSSTFDNFFNEGSNEGYEEGNRVMADRHRALLFDLQDVHDMAQNSDDPVAQWKEDLTSVAETYGLDTKVLQS